MQQMIKFISLAVFLFLALLIFIQSAYAVDVSLPKTCKKNKVHPLRDTLSA